MPGTVDTREQFMTFPVYYAYLTTSEKKEVDAVKTKEMHADDYYAKTSDLSILVKAIIR